jgi:hypothetical protein
MMNWHSIRPAAMIVAAALLSPLWCSGSSRADGATDRDSLYVGDFFGVPGPNNTFQVISNSVSQFDAETGAFIRVLINGSTGGIHGANGIVVDHLRPPKLVVANQNAALPVNGDIRVFDETTGALDSILVPGTSEHAVDAPFGVLLYSGACCSGEVLVADEGDYPVDENPPGQVVAYDATDGTWLANFDTTGYPNAFHPFGMVIGPDGKLYVSNRITEDPATGDVLRFDPRTRKFLNVFVDGAKCRCNLDHPNGLAFGPDGRFYVTSSYHSTPTSSRDTDKILIFDGFTGRYVDKIDLDVPGGQRFAAPGILFGPRGLLYATLLGLTSSGPAAGNADGVGALRVYEVATKQFRTIVPPGSQLLRGPTLFTFGKTNPATLVYEGDDQYAE